jgi:hypothetical protein
MNIITNLEQSPLDSRDYIFEHVGTYGVDLPTTLDMRDDLLAVRNQGSDGACVAFTASAMKEVQEKRDVGFKEYMSPQFIYSNRINKTTEGMYPRDLMRILTKIGIVPEKMMPYQKNTRITSYMRTTASNYRISGYASINTIDALKTSLVKNGPALLGVPVYNYGARLWSKGPLDKFLGGHAVAVVGWNDTGFIIRNSWGASWNGDGHTIFPFTDWGLQWEIWTTIDAESAKIVAPKPTRSSTSKARLRAQRRALLLKRRAAMHARRSRSRRRR